MKQFFALTAAAAAMTFASCGGSDAGHDHNGVDTVKVDTMAKEVTYTVDTAASSVRWQGNMTGLKSYSHFGTLKFNSGTVTTKGGMITGGTFEVNMRTINPQDSGYSKEHPREGLVGHLSTAEFFAVDSFPTASLKVLSMTGNTANAELTVRGRTLPQTITDVVVTENMGTLTATGKLVFDRQKYGVSWKAMKDMMLADNIELAVDLTAKAK